MDTHSKPGLDAPLMPEAADTFSEVSVARLAMMLPEMLDGLPYGVIGMATDGTVDIYNAAESRLAGLSPSRVLGQHLFTVVAPCMNNYLVAQRLEDEVELDVIVPYVLTLRMRPTPVKLRLLRTTDQRPHPAWASPLGYRLLAGLSTSPAASSAFDTAS
jgi:photoactive yellow protein